jgi:hypothetical protein
MNFINKAGKEKIAALGGDYIRDRLREESFARKARCRLTERSGLRNA